jgi:hypothetical protein
VSRNSSPFSGRRLVTHSIKAQIRALYASGNGISLLRIAVLLDIDPAIVRRVVNYEEPERVI